MVLCGLDEVFGKDRDEGVQYMLVILIPQVGLHDLKRFKSIHGGLIASIGRHRVKAIGDGSSPAVKVDLFSCQTPWISFAIQSFVVLQDG